MSNNDINQRRTKQMIAFYGMGLLTIGSAFMARRSTISRIYKPNQFQANHLPPHFNIIKDAIGSLVPATLLSVSTFGFFVSGVIWFMDVNSPRDFSRKMSNMLGGAEKQKILEKMPVSEEVREFESLMGGGDGKGGSQ